jgi:hypothetical protein
LLENNSSEYDIIYLSLVTSIYFNSLL